MSKVSAITPMPRLTAPMIVRPGVRSTFTTARPVIPDGWRARRTASTGGRTAATGSARAAKTAGTAPAASASASATGMARAARAGEACSPSAAASGGAARAPRMPAVRPISVTSPSTAANNRGLVQPRAASTPSSVRRPRTAAVAELATNSAQTTRISTNSVTLLRSTAFRMLIATPFLTQPSLSSSAGVPYLSAGTAIVVGAGEDPATMSTVRWVRSSICSATALIRFREAWSGPTTPPTRTRITLIGA